MKITIISIGSFDSYYADYHIMRDIIVELLERGNYVELIQKKYLDIPKYPEKFYKYIGNQLNIINIPFNKKPKQNLKSRYFADLLYYFRACRIMKKNKPDKIFLQSNNTSFYTIFYSKYILKRPVLYNEQDIFPENAYFAGVLKENSYTYRIAHMLQKYTYINATVLTTISCDMKNTIASMYGVSNDKIKVIYNWGHEEYIPKKNDENYFLNLYPKSNGEFRVLYAGNIGKMQNIELILETANLLRENKDVKFFIIGEGVNKVNLKKITEEKELYNVYFLDIQTPDKVYDIYSSSDVNIIPLRRKIIYTALPSKTADCLMSGKPIIACVDEDSHFSYLLEKYSILNAGPSSPLILKEKILSIKNNIIVANNKDLWMDYFMKEKNVALHCDFIEQMR